MKPRRMGAPLACLLLAACASAPARWATPLQEGELLSRSKYGDYEKATYSFEHGLRDDPDLSITRNDWDLQFGNGGDVFSVTMVTDDRSRIVDLGPATWDELDRMLLPRLAPHADPEEREPDVAVVAGHVYLVRTVDSGTDQTAVLLVEELVPGDKVRFTWRRLAR